MKLKICGLKNETDIQAVNQAKIDMVGFVIDYPPSKRSIQKQEVKKLADKLDPSIMKVGVFVDAPLDTMLDLVQEGSIDAIQLHGQEQEDMIEQLKKQTTVPIIQAFQVDPKLSFDTVNASKADLVLLDAGKGEGKTFDWDQLQEVKRKFALAGGIDAHNIQQAMRYEPYMIDVSSGAEENGQKTAARIQELIQKMKGQPQ